jgi:hypothetical protein
MKQHIYVYTLLQTPLRVCVRVHNAAVPAAAESFLLRLLVQQLQDLCPQRKVHQRIGWVYKRNHSARSWYHTGSWYHTATSFAALFLMRPTCNLQLGAPQAPVHLALPGWL